MQNAIFIWKKKMWCENSPKTLSAIVTSINIKHCVFQHIRTHFYATLDVKPAKKKKEDPKLFKHWMQRSDKLLWWRMKKIYDWK